MILRNYITTNSKLVLQCPETILQTTRMPLSKKKEKFGKNKVINSTVEASK
jgi:hypothetical protein